MLCRTQCFLFLLLFLFPGDALAWPGYVVSVSDGDTIAIAPEHGGTIVKVRLHGIDAPERNQPDGQSARVFVVNTALFQIVDVQETQGKDRYGRTVAVVVLRGGESLQAALLNAGLAWVWPRYCRNCQEWQALQDEARSYGRGLWGSPEPVPPWQWRQRKK